MKKVLVFSYYWPPGSGPGVQRVLKFCKYLREFGWEPIVITVRDGSYPSTDETLLLDVPPDLRVYATDTRDPFKIYNALQGKKGKEVGVGLTGIRESRSPLKRFSMYVRANYFIPDARKGWKKFALKQARELLESEKIDLIFTSSPPHSSQFIGLELQRETGLPWVADFRDPWTTIYYNQYLPRTAKSVQLDHKLENQILRSADLVTVVSPGLAIEFGDRTKAIEVLYNGFDEADMVREPVEPSSRFVVAYTGNFKPNQNVPELWAALSELATENSAFAAALLLSFTGNMESAVLENIQSLGLANNVELNAFVPHKEATKLMHKADVLLFIVPEAKGNAVILTGKLFEYLAAGSRMLSIGPVAGNAAAIVNECGRAPMIDYRNAAALKNRVAALFAEWQEHKGNPKYEPSTQLNRYSRKGQAQQLAALFDSLTNKRT